MNNSISTNRKRRTIKTKMLKSTSVLPAIFTLGNALAGFGAIHFATKCGIDAKMDQTSIENMRVAVFMLIGAMVFDMLDGRVARMTRSTSDFGAQLDSLCDMVSFGVAPAVMALRASVGILRTVFDPMPMERVLWCIAAVYVACAAMRLARFNVETETDESAHMDFRGLPSPGAAGVVMATILFFTWLIDQEVSWLKPRDLLITMSIMLPIVSLAAGLLMVSRFRYPHLINQYIRGKKPFSYLVKLVLILLGVAMWPYPTLAAVGWFFAFSPPVKSCVLWLIVRRKRT